MYKESYMIDDCLNFKKTQCILRFPNGWGKGRGGGGGGGGGEGGGVTDLKIKL